MARNLRREKAKVESPVVRWALDYLRVPSIPLKLTRGSDTGRPDDIFLIPGGRPLFIEFKDPSGQVDPKQAYWREVLEKLDYAVTTCNDPEDAKQAVARAVCNARLAALGATTLYAQGGEMAFRTLLRRALSRPRFAQDFYYTSGLQFLEEAWDREQDASDRAP